MTDTLTLAESFDGTSVGPERQAARGKHAEELRTEESYVQVFLLTAAESLLPIVSGRFSSAVNKSMAPVLHQMYSFDDAITSFGNETLPEFFCQDSFIVVPNAEFCLATLGDAASEPHLQSPSCLIWKRPDCRAWLPGKVTEVWDRSGPQAKKLRDHHVFLRMPDDEAFLYAGPGHLGSYGGPEYAANFSLETKLPRETWLRYGGYSGWSVEVNHQAHSVKAGDLPAFRRLVTSLPSQEFSHLGMTRYEEDSLTLHTNARRGWLMYLREPGDGGLYTHDVDYQGDTKAEEVFRCVCGIDLEFSARSTLPRDTAMRVTEDFFVHGELPKSVPWVVDPSAVE
jgi:hypothetical protein